MDERNKIEYVVGDKKFYGQEIVKKGKVDIKKLYDELIPWFSEFKYKFIEKNITGKEAPSGRYEKIEWTADRKIDSYFRFHINTEFVIYRIKGETAELTLRFKGYLEKDYRNTFKRSDVFGLQYGKFGEILRRVYERYVIKDRVEEMKGKLRLETREFIELSKKILELRVK